MGTTDDLERWHEAGLIDADQVEAITAFDGDTSDRRTSVGRDVVAYLGGALIVAACIVIAAEVWPDLGWVAQASLSAVAAAVLTGVGVGFSRSDTASTRRVGHVALALATVAVGVTVGVVIDAIATDADVAVAAGFGAATAYSGWWYVRHRTWAQHFAVFASLVGFILALAFEPGGADRAELGGLVLIVVGLAWLGLATARRLPPRLEGEILGILGAGLGSFIIVAELNPETGIGLASLIVFVGMSGGLIALGVWLDRVAVIAGGVAGLLVYLPWLANEILGEGAGAPIALLTAGAGLVGLALILGRRTTG